MIRKYQNFEYFNKIRCFKKEELNDQKRSLNYTRSKNKAELTNGLNNVENMLKTLVQRVENLEKENIDLKDQLKTKTESCGLNNNNGKCHETELLHEIKDERQILKDELRGYVKDTEETNIEKFNTLYSDLDWATKLLEDHEKKLNSMVKNQIVEGKMKDWCKAEMAKQLVEKEKKINEYEDQNKKLTQEVYKLDQKMNELNEKQEVLYETNSENNRITNNQRETLSETNKRMANTIKDQKKLETVITEEKNKETTSNVVNTRKKLSDLFQSNNNKNAERQNNNNDNLFGTSNYTDGKTWQNNDNGVKEQNLRIEENENKNDNQLSEPKNNNKGMDVEYARERVTSTNNSLEQTN